MNNIDFNRLDRDFREYPYVSKKGHGCISTIEKPSKNDLEYLYVELNMRKDDICKLLGVASTTFTRWLSYYGIKKPTNKMVENLVKTNLERYGVAHYAGDIEKSKKTRLERYGNENYVNVEKMKQTKFERYGDSGYHNVEKMKQTNIDRYGKTTYTQTDEYKERLVKTNRMKYGVDYFSQTQEFRDMVISTNNKKYGRDSFSQINYDEDLYQLLSNRQKLKEYIEKSNIKTYYGIAKVLGINDTNFRRIIIKYDLEYLISSEWSSSYQETEIKDYINQHFETENNTRKYLDGKEIDIFIPCKNIGIEFNGNFWHNEFGKDKKYHQDKSLLAEEKGIFLYHIFEYDWDNKKEQIINQLNNLLGINEHKIYARKCEVRDVSLDEKVKFLNNNHLQGDDKSSIKLGLYYDDELVSLMTFVKPRFNKNYEWELSRFCSKAGCNVIGGASKLFKYFIKMYKPSSIISYSNIAHTKGNLYHTLGMKLQGISNPNYVWCNHNDILTRYQCQKHKLLEQGFEGNSETDIMHNRGYYKIYDCGNKVWVWENC